MTFVQIYAITGLVALLGSLAVHKWKEDTATRQFLDWCDAVAFMGLAAIVGALGSVLVAGWMGWPT